MLRYVVVGLALSFAVSASAQEKPKAAPAANEKWETLFDGKSLEGWKVTNFGGEGEVTVKDGQVILEMGQPMTGLTIKDGSKLPKDNYEITLQAMKRKGDDFFCALTFPVRDTHASFVVGGWGGSVVGLSSIDGQDASENETTDYATLEKNKWYAVRVRVTNGKVQCWLNDKQQVDIDSKEKKLSIRIEVDPNKPLGVACYNVEAAMKDIKLRRLEK